MKLTYPMFEKSMSSYLKEGFKEDDFQIKMVDIHDDQTHLTACVDLISHTTSIDGTFHLSALTNSRIVQQIGIIFSCHVMQSEKDREIYFLSDSWKYKKSINTFKNIQYEFNNIVLRRSKHQTIGRCQVNVEEGAFLGNVVWLIPNNPYEISAE